MYISIIEIMKTLIKISADKETPSIFWLGSQLTIIVNKPDDMKAVLMSPNCLQKPYVYDFIGGISIFNSPGNIEPVTYSYLKFTTSPISNSACMEKGSQINQSYV